MAFYITGDCHGNFKKIHFFCSCHRTTVSDVMIVLGDAGINFWLARTDEMVKDSLKNLPITLFMIHGNHEERPFLIDSYKEKEWNGGIVYYEEKYPNLLFAKDGEIYDFDGKRTIVLGGAYSIDKDYRLKNRLPWFESEQPSAEIKETVRNKLDEAEWKVDYVFSHTCPNKYVPTDLFLDFIDQSKVDKSTEEWLTQLEEKIQYEKWYFAHFHENRKYEKGEMLYEEIKELGSDDFLQRLGRPKYKAGDLVLFYFHHNEKKCEIRGEVYIIDSYGTFEQVQEVSYDIMGNDGCLYKHIPESLLEPIH